MKKIQSEALYRYLLHGGHLTHSDEEIAIAKQNYRREYKQKWKRERHKQKPEIRVNFTKKELDNLKKSASEKDLTPTAFVRQSAIALSTGQPLIPKKDTLLSILQKVSMATIILENKKQRMDFDSEIQEISLLLEASETLLVQYVSQ